MQLVQESRIRWDGILAMHGEAQLHNILTNVPTHKIKQCCSLYNTFLIMNYNTAWFIGPLLSHLNRTTPEIVFNRAETTFLR